MRIKKIVWLLLISVFVMQFAPVGSAETVYNEKYIEIAAAISGMDVSQNETVTRAEFSRLLAMSMNGDVPTEGAQYFEDVKPGDYAYGSISQLASMGIVAGDGVNFYPSQTITRNEAIKIAVMALGYQLPAEQKGEGFGGYLMMAGQLHLLSGMSGASELTGKDAMMLLYNTMHTEMLEITSFSDKGYQSEISDAEFLQFYRGIYRTTGIVNATAYTALGGYSTTSGNAVVVGNLSLKNALPIYHTYIGRSVKAYYTLDDGAELVYLAANEQNYTVYTAEEIADDATAHTLTRLALKEDDKFVKISQYADFIWNGRLYAAITPADLAFSDGYVELIDNGGDSAADIVMIHSIEYAKVSAVDEMNRVIYGGTSQRYALDDAEFYTLTDENGMEISLTEVVADDVLEVQKSREANHYLLQMKRVRNSFSGKISSLETDEDGGYIIGVGEESYQTTRAFNATSEAAQLGVSKYAIFYLNADGKIAAIKYTAESDMLYGYLLEAKAPTGFGNDAKLQIYTQENKCVAYELADKVSVNYANAKQTEADIITTLKNGNPQAVQQMVRFSVDQDGEINKLFIASELREYDGNTEFYKGPETIYKYSNSSKLLYVYGEQSTAFYVGDAVAYFNVVRHPIGQLSNSARLTEEDIYVSYAPHLVESGDAHSIVYDFGYTKNAKCVITEPQSRTVVYDTNLVLINDVRKTLDQNGEENLKIYGWKKSQKVIYEASEYLKLQKPNFMTEIQSGDVVVATFDRTEFGQLETIQTAYSASTPWQEGFDHYSNSPVSLAYGKQTVIRATAYDRDDAVLCVNINGEKQALTTNYLTNYYYYNSNSHTYTPTVGTEIRTERESASGSKLVIYSRYGVAYDIIILD